MSHRTGKVADVVRAQISALIRELGDPRIGFVTVTAVELSSDLRHARVHVSALGAPAVVAEALAGLRGATGWLRREVGKRCALRHAPELTFVEDPTIARAARIEETLRDDRIAHPPRDDDGEAAAPNRDGEETE